MPYRLVWIVAISVMVYNLFYADHASAQIDQVPNQQSNAGKKSSEFFLPHKLTYFLYTEHRIALQDRLRKELKFQISAKKVLWDSCDIILCPDGYFGYTQRSFWQYFRHGQQ